jgi:exopolyphosphatase/guanosine-5'-triphosphate,3'-diphosphate pyrophosphatase
MNDRLEHLAHRAQGRLDAGRPIAIIDIGSNSVRLVAYEAATRALTPIYNEKTMCGLGRKVATSGKLDPDAVDLALRTLRRFRKLCDIIGAEDVTVLATAAARDASNGPAFLGAAEEACGTKIELLSGNREAQLSALGVVSGVHRPDGVVGDLGGGSLELIDVTGGTPRDGETFRLGVLTLEDIAGGSRKEARRIVRQVLTRAPQLEALHGRTFYAVGGTWRALARLHMRETEYPLHILHGYRIDATDAVKFLRRVARTEPKALGGIELVSKDRRPLLAYGAIVLGEILRLGAPASVEVSALGVREGFIFDRLAHEGRDTDPLLAAAADFNVLRSRSPRHGEDLRSWTDRFVESAGEPESDDERRLRHAACLLADIGWRAHPDYRGEQSFNLIAHAAFVGIDHPGRAYLALSILYRYDGLGNGGSSTSVEHIAGPRLTARAKLLARLMRVAYPMTVATGGVLPRTAIFRRGRRLVLELPSDLRALAGERLDRRLAQLARMLSLDPAIAIVERE